MITGINIETESGKKVTLTLEEARALFNELKKVFGSQYPSATRRRSPFDIPPTPWDPLNGPGVTVTYNDD